MTWQSVLRAIGRGLMMAGLAIIRLFWGAFVEIVRGASRGAGRLIEQVAPWAVGAGVLWGLVVFEPQLFQQLLALGIVLFVIRAWSRKVLPAPSKKKK